MSVSEYVYMWVPREIRVLRSGVTGSCEQSNLDNIHNVILLKMQAVDYMNMFTGSPQIKLSTMLSRPYSPIQEPLITSG